MNHLNHELNKNFVQHHQTRRHQEAESARLAETFRDQSAGVEQSSSPAYAAALARVGQWMQQAGQSLEGAGERIQARHNEQRRAAQ